MKSLYKIIFSYKSRISLEISSKLIELLELNIFFAIFFSSISSLSNIKVKCLSLLKFLFENYKMFLENPVNSKTPFGSIEIICGSMFSGKTVL